MKQKFFRWSFYILGLLLLAVGLTLNTKTDLGASAIISVPFSISQIWDLNFGVTTYAAYVVLVMMQLVICRMTAQRYTKKQQRVRLVQAVLQLPFSLIFTWVMERISVAVTVLKESSPDGFLNSFPGRIAMLLVAVILTGVGCAMSLNMRLVPNPGDGAVRALAEVTGKTVGFAKNCFDICCVALSVTLGLSMVGEVVGVGLGTLIAVLCTGRVVALFDRLFSKRICDLAGMEQDITAKK